MKILMANTIHYLMGGNSTHTFGLTSLGTQIVGIPEIIKSALSDRHRGKSNRDSINQAQCQISLSRAYKIYKEAKNYKGLELA